MPVSTARLAQVQLQRSYEIKSAQLPVVAMLLKTSQWDVLATDLVKQFGTNGECADFFDHDALVLDFSHLAPDAPLQDLNPLLAALRSCRLNPVAVRGASAECVEAARAFGLAEALIDLPRARGIKETQESKHEQVPEIIRKVPGTSTMVVDKPLRSGQKIYARGADLVILAMVNQGAEVVADGNIHVYAPLRGKAMAGASGNTNARIFSLSFEPELISIAGIYRTSETPLASDVRGKPAQVRLSNDGQEKLLIEALKA